MAQSPADRAHTSALKALIRRTVDELQQIPGRETTDAVLFLGNPHQAFPALLVQDPVLEPVDKIVWMVFTLQAQTAGKGAAFLRYREIAGRANIASTATVSRAIAILRATRWLSLCARVRDRQGRFRGNVYALHDEPLTLADTFALDAEYMVFLQGAERHHHARVRRIATAVLASLDEAIADGEDVLASANAIERRLEAQTTLSAATGRYFSLSAKAMAKLSNLGSDCRSGNRDQILKLDRFQNLKPVSSSSSSKKINKNKTTTTTTTTRTTETARKSKTVDGEAALVFPQRLTDNQRAVAARYLARLPPAQRQPVLDELEGRLRAERRGAPPVYDELQYLLRLCQCVKEGGFQPNLGLKVQTERARRAAETGHRPAKPGQLSSNSPAPKSRERGGEDSLAKARKILGISPRRPDPAR